MHVESMPDGVLRAVNWTENVRVTEKVRVTEEAPCSRTVALGFTTNALTASCL